MNKHIQQKIASCRLAVERSHNQIDYHRRRASACEANARYLAEQLQDLLRVGYSLR